VILILKFVVFYGGAFIALVATIFLWLFWRPELKAEAIGDESAKSIRCTFRAIRTLSPIRLSGICLPVEYVKSMGASPPEGFCEKLDRETPERLYDNAKREVLTWSGRLEVARGQVVELSIPARHPKAVSGTLFLLYEFRGIGGVLISAGSIHVPFNKKEATSDPVRAGGIAGLQR
jgi:hypothetical protein